MSEETSDFAAEPAGIATSSTVVAPTWLLSGPPGAQLDHFVGVLICAGATVECVEPQKVYRVSAIHPDTMKAFDEGLAAHSSGYRAAPEEPSKSAVDIRLYVAPPARFARYVSVQGTHGASFVARALDAGMFVKPAGNLRWFVAGPSLALYRWLMTTIGKTAEDLAAMGWNPEQLASEDGPSVVALPKGPLVVDVASLPKGALPVDVTSMPKGPLPVDVASMPTRFTSTSVIRGDQREIVRVDSTETDDGPSPLADAARNDAPSAAVHALPVRVTSKEGRRDEQGNLVGAESTATDA